MAKKVLIMGAGGKDFQVFNCTYRDNPEFEVVAFTATQIPGIDERTYPASIAGKLYPNGIAIMPEEELEDIIREKKVELVIFAYSDVSYDYLSEREEKVRAAGAEFIVAEPKHSMLPAEKPVIAVCAVRTGAGKSPVSRAIVGILSRRGRKVVIVRHPMPYGDLSKQEVERFETIKDLAKHKCTIEEMEEYEPHINNGAVVYAGVDYGKILEEAQKEADIILWDGGNNDTPFYAPSLHITILDPLRAGDELTYYPGRDNLEMADVLIINKVDQATESDLDTVTVNIDMHNPDATVIMGRLVLSVDDSAAISGKRVLVVEDGPTLTHGGMKFGAGVVAARQFGAKELIDPRPFVVGEVKETFEKYPEIGSLLPAVGYSAHQIADLEKTINSSDAELVVIATPINLSRIVEIEKPTVRVTYDYKDVGEPTLASVLARV
jgi:predicted GTPase